MFGQLIFMCIFLVAFIFYIMFGIVTLRWLPSRINAWGEEIIQVWCQWVDFIWDRL